MPSNAYLPGGLVFGFTAKNPRSKGPTTEDDIPTDWASLFVTLFEGGTKIDTLLGTSYHIPLPGTFGKSSFLKRVGNGRGYVNVIVLRKVYIPESTNVPNGQVRFTRFWHLGHPGHRLPLPGAKSDHAVPCGGRLQGGGNWGRFCGGICLKCVFMCAAGV